MEIPSRKLSPSADDQKSCQIISSQRPTQMSAAQMSGHLFFDEGKCISPTQRALDKKKISTQIVELSLKRRVHLTAWSIIHISRHASFNCGDWLREVQSCIKRGKIVSEFHE